MPAKRSHLKEQEKIILKNLPMEINQLCDLLGTRRSRIRKTMAWLVDNHYVRKAPRTALKKGGEWSRIICQIPKALIMISKKEGQDREDSI